MHQLRCFNLSCVFTELKHIRIYATSSLIPNLNTFSIRLLLAVFHCWEEVRPNLYIHKASKCRSTTSFLFVVHYNCLQIFFFLHVHVGRKGSSSSRWLLLLRFGLEKLSLPNIQRTWHAKKWTRPVKWWSSSFLEQLSGSLAHLALQVVTLSNCYLKSFRCVSLSALPLARLYNSTAKLEYRPAESGLKQRQELITMNNTDRIKSALCAEWNERYVPR